MSTVFILGASGYIGGAVLVGLKRTFPEYEFTALIRNPQQVSAVEALGVKVVQGSHSDLSIITEAASKADIVVNAADADDLQLARAIFAGLAKTGTPEKKKIYIHTSGTGLVVDQPTGKFNPNLKVYNDNEVEDIRSIPPTAPHRNVDLEIFAEDSKNTYVSAYIIAPSTIYAEGDGPVHQISQQIPGLIELALKNKKAIYVGEGTNQWNNVHIKDLVELYILVAKLAVSENNIAAPVDSYEKFFWGSAGTHVWGDIVRSIAKILYKKGLVESPEAESSPEVIREVMFTANNSRTIADRSKKLGWAPAQKDVFDSLEATVDAVIARQNRSK